MNPASRKHQAHMDRGSIGFHRGNPCQLPPAPAPCQHAHWLYMDQLPVDWVLTADPLDFTGGIHAKLNNFMIRISRVRISDYR